MRSSPVCQRSEKHLLWSLSAIEQATALTITLPPLVALIDSSSPDYPQVLTQRGVAAFFVASIAAARISDELVAVAEQLAVPIRASRVWGLGLAADT